MTTPIKPAGDSDAMNARDTAPTRTNTAQTPYSDGVGIRPRLSRPLVAITATSLVAGLISGGVTYLNRSPHLATHVDGTAAWAAHIVVFMLAGGVTMVVLRRRPAPTGRLSLLAPLGTTAASRLAHTVHAARHHPTAVLRLLIGILPMAMLVFGPYRIGVQVLAGLDPNFTVNAWGGPSYLGAMACHYLDGGLLMAASAGLLNLLLLPVGHRQASNRREQ